MKLATLSNGKPDGQLFVVSSDLKRCVSAGRIASNLQAALDDWQVAQPELEALSTALNAGDISGQKFEQEAALAPLPRAYQWIDGGGYLGHIERVRALSGGEAPEGEQRVLLHQGASDQMRGACENIIVPMADLSIDLGAEIAVICGPVSMGSDAATAAESIRLVTLCNNITLRRLVAADLEEGFGFFHSKPTTSFAPIVATPDELAGTWQGTRLSARVDIAVNDLALGRLQAGEGMHFDFAHIIAEACRTRNLGAGTIVGSGTIANKHEKPLPLGRDDVGFGCIAEARTLEKALDDVAKTPFLRPGDKVQLAALDADGGALFGTIRQQVKLSGTGPN